jgi:Asp-tRNA(Asn)/Glu-tRNA(Gln) amidotransferase C subunit
MEKTAAVSVAERCAQLFGIEIERERVEVLAGELTGILREVEKLRELDLADVPPVVVFDPDRVYREAGND